MVRISNKLKIHFMGIGGSGISGVALMAKANGFEVSGCDFSKDTAYINELKKEIKNIEFGHDPSHLEDVDKLIISPAILYLNKNHSEIKKAKEKNIEILTWEKFLGEYLAKDKKVIAVCGTHGKSTTASMIGLMLEKARLDPNVMVGATVKEWNKNCRIGNGNHFVIEADEFNNNFLHYFPDIIILNNVEFDHPDFFKDESEVFESFSKFVNKLKTNGYLIVNWDSVGVRKVVSKIEKVRLGKVNLIKYSINNNDINVNEKGSVFKYEGESYQLVIPGVFNVANATGVVILGKLLGINYKTIKQSLMSFGGIGRRLDLIGEVNKIKIYDDYAHHPTAIKVTLEALRQKYPKNRIWVVNEPHSFSRTKALLKDYKGVFDQANKLIITQIYKARDKSDFGISGRDVVRVSKHRDGIYIETFEDVISKLITELKQSDIVIVMGAGRSYLLSRNILDSRLSSKKLVSLTNVSK